MEFKAHQSFRVLDRSYISLVKRDIMKLAESYGFNENHIGKINIIISELTSNLVKHTTTGGEILVKLIYKNRLKGIEIICLDNGPGMREPSRMMQDGVSTFGSKGEGLGAIKRMSDEFDMYSLSGNGTVLLSRIYIGGKETEQKKSIGKYKCSISAVMVAKPGETVCGDGWTVVQDEEKCVVMAVDGLGHGPQAELAAQLAIQSFRGCMECIPSKILQLVHQSIKNTRGVVGALASIDFKNYAITYCGIGNIASRILSAEGNKNLLSYNGTIGHNIPTNFNDHIFELKTNSLLIMHSDGLKTRWDLSKYPGLLTHDTSVIAGLLYKDNNRTTDDTLIIVGRINS